MKFAKPLTIKEISRLINAEIIGDENLLIEGIGEVHRVETGELSFVDNVKYYEKALKSQASAVLLNVKEIENPLNKTLLYSEDPFTAFNRLIEIFCPFVPATKTIADDVEIGEGTIIQPLTFIGHNVKIGKNCIIHSNVSIYDNTIIGDNVIVHSGSVIGGDGYYFQKRADGWHKFNSCGRTILCNDVEVGANCAIDRGSTYDTTIGEGTKLDNFVHIGHDTIVGKRCLIGANSTLAGVLTIEDDVLIWGQVVINKDLVIGKEAVVLATSAVDKSLEGGKIYFGMPAIEARKKWRELAALRNLPDLLETLNKK
ncbi:UDP-3-O-(3-hydroxymyristoyl)glucosamine N-acyltransferase [Bacteroidia bacterium]|nr:UDP-3-O-(3-hydroxymyristoyl)glucosamine N-acyltransferase [Bacteroidia bacterium]